MKRIFTILCAALMTLSTVKAEVLFDCNFNDSTVGRLSVGAWNSGTLPSDAWYTNGNPGTYRQVAEGQLSYSGYSSNTIGKAVTTSGNNQKDYILFESGKQKTSLTAGQKYYLSFLFKATTLNTSDNAKSGTNSYAYIAGLLTSATGTGIAWTQGVVQIKTTSDNSKFNFGIRKKNESTVYGSTEFSPNETYLVVVEYEVKDGVQNDVVNLYINPDKTSPVAEASTSSQTYASGYADATGFVGVGILSGAASPTGTVTDEIKVATSWDDLWEDGGSGGGGGDPTPVINVTSTTAAFGTVNVGKAVTKDITVSGKDLKAAISVLSSDPAVEVSDNTISIAQAEAVEGHTLTLTLTPASAGAGSATVKLSSTDASEKVISVSWTGVVAPTKIANIAALKATTYEETKFYELESEPIVIRWSMGGTVLQDESGALIATNYLGNPLSYNVGDKVQIKKAQLYEFASDYVDGFHSILVLDDALISSDNAATPFAVNASNFDSYGPALVKLSNVGFKNPGTQFASGVYDITDDYGTSYVSIPAACDIVGETIPAKADITGLVVRASGKNAIRIDSKADVQAKSATGIGEVRSETTNVVRSKKKIINGQLVIIKDGKMFNVIGVEL